MFAGQEQHFSIVVKKSSNRNMRVIILPTTKLIMYVGKTHIKFTLKAHMNLCIFIIIHYSTVWALVN